MPPLWCRSGHACRATTTVTQQHLSITTRHRWRHQWRLLAITQTIRTGVSRGPLQCRHDYRITTLDTTVLEARLKIMFQEQTQSFKIDLSYVFVLRNKNTGRYKYYHSSCNCCETYLDKPSLIINSEDVDIFLERIRQTDALQWAINQRSTGFGVGV